MSWKPKWEGKWTTWDAKLLLSDSKACVPMQPPVKQVSCAYCESSSLPVTAVPHANMKKNPLECDLHREALASGTVWKEEIVIIEMINFFYSNFLHEPGRRDGGIMSKHYFVFALMCLTA